MPADKKTWSYKVWLVVVSKPFELFIMALIILNTIVLMMEVGSNDVIFNSEK
jgi:hypothetical protein